LSSGLSRKSAKYQAEEKLEEIVRRENGKVGSAVAVRQADDTVTFGWFVEEKYLPIRRGCWRRATRDKTEFEINKYLVKEFNDVPLRTIGLFELQKLLNDLAAEYCESIVKHAFVNLRSIMKLAHRLKFIPENPGEETKMPATKAIERPTMTPEQISSLMGAIEDPHDLCLMCIGLFCASRSSETLGLQWKSYLGDKLTIHSTAYEGELYRGPGQDGC
jgi:integrase